MKKYILLDGGQITASGAKEFLRLLREGSWFDNDCTDHEYMERFAKRYKESHGVTIDTGTPEQFMADLMKDGYVKEQ